MSPFLSCIFWAYSAGLVCSTRHLEPIHVDVKELDDDRLTVAFDAFALHFRLLLTRHPLSVLTPTTRVSTLWPRTRVDVTYLFGVQGTVFGWNVSAVTGTVCNGSFAGTVHVDGKRYVVQRLRNETVIYGDADKWSEAMINDVGEHHAGLHTGDIRKRDFTGDNNGTDYTYLLDKNVCSLRVLVDHVFFARYSDRSLASVVQSVATIIEDVNRILNTTDFDGNGFGGDVGVQIAEIEIYANIDAGNYRFYEDQYSAVHYLSVFSEYPLAEFCLGIAFTGHRFTDGFIGIGYPHDHDINLPGGICQSPTTLLATGATHSFNCIAVSVQSPTGHALSHSVNVVNLAHQMGHSLGSAHDDPQEEDCHPKTGTYIMADKLGRGEPNNMLYSPCSKKQILQTLLDVGRSCLQARLSICGNGVTEPGEECDCGPRDQCYLLDDCCIPVADFVSETPGCKLKRGAQCSPRESYCCSQRCQVVPAYTRKDCTRGNECLEPTICNGNSSDCPKMKSMPDGTACLRGMGQCRRGVCHDTTCAKIGLQPCSCISKLKDLCKVCCHRQGLCLPFLHWGYTQRHQGYLFRPDGESCDYGKGVCDQGECVAADLGGEHRQTTPKTTTDKTKTDTKEDGSVFRPTPWFIAGASVGAIVGVAIVGFIAILVWFKMRRRRVFTASVERKIDMETYTREFL